MREDSQSDFYVISADSPEEIQAKLLRVVTERLPQRFGLHPIRDVQVLTPMNRGSLGARALNAVLQQVLNPEATPQVTRFGWTYAATVHKSQGSELTGCKFQVPQNLRRLINVYAINFMP
jgi:ATP-dependent exoDNAse (exonuclease V) alpha subunit